LVAMVTVKIQSHSG